MKNLGRQLYNAFGISEWDEKCVALDSEEQKHVLKMLAENKSDELVEIVKLPYHKFIVEYIKFIYYFQSVKRTKGIKGLDELISNKGLEDPSIGYKLYVIPNRLMKEIMMYIKYPYVNISSIFTPFKDGYNLNELVETLNKPLTEVYKYTVSQRPNKEVMRKYIHIMSYIDKEEAERLGLKDSFTFNSCGEYRGFDMKDKLDSLNPLIKHILMEYLGFNGSYKGLKEIENELHVDYVNALITDDLLRSLTKSCLEFRYDIKYIPDDYQDGERIRYAYVKKLTPRGSKKPFSLCAESVERSFVKYYLENNSSLDEKLSRNDLNNIVNGFDMGKVLKKTM